ncbi:hypothetical protein EDB95_1494 [Dinghuibacter silviterrae]|uniref:Uncharacterized protein n=1 Tax=Dinghuibacter silviterrae TaxID=1539049 RepID=A0A4R8DR78_9BACT|nr:hypothetical protein EDB95_1494 [Dinghuibacter silviterrae]
MQNLQRQATIIRRLQHFHPERISDVSTPNQHMLNRLLASLPTPNQLNKFELFQIVKLMNNLLQLDTVPEVTVTADAPQSLAGSLAF